LIRWSIQEIRRIAIRLARKRIQPAHIIAWSLWRRDHQAVACCPDTAIPCLRYLEHVEEMITLFQVNGAMIYVDPDGKTTGYDDVFTCIDKCRAHCSVNGPGADYIDQFIR
jgi:hypothetical protein